MNSRFFYLDDLDALREKLARASRDGTRLGLVWDSVVRRARSAPGDFPWFTPLVALVGGEPQDIENAKGTIRRYLRTLDDQSFGMGLHFHFWCWAFPHARLHLLPILGSDDYHAETVAGYPDRLDGASLRVDFTQHGTECRWLWLAWPEATRRVASDEAEGWAALPDAVGALDPDAARAGLATVAQPIPLTQPPFLLRDLPVCRRWWFGKRLAVPTGAAWLRLPKRMLEPRLWIDGAQIDLAPHALRLALLEPEIPLPSSAAGRTVEILLRCDTGHSQYAPGGNHGAGFSGCPALLVSQPAAGVESAEYRDGRITLRAGGREWMVAHTLLET